MGEFAARLRGDGVELSLDRWIAGLGRPLPGFMADLVREHDRLLVICTPAYEERSGSRIGGVALRRRPDDRGGAETQRSKRGKFMAVAREGNPTASIRSQGSSRT